jgi:pimeloyl-ACP methyl ester carboxylesterase
MPYITVGKESSGNIDLYYKDWGSGQPAVFSHGWPLSADAWEDQMVFLASHGYRCIAHDRRGHGRSGQPWNGNDMDTYADDLATLAYRTQSRWRNRSEIVVGREQIVSFLQRKWARELDYRLIDD